ncbi:MAG: relaxase/mobilization nuclease domain-containing protein [Ruminococcus sp.]|nr:relaxase/mobilization nuclease domain-containing protein [Ruminococcus sp.]
MIRSTIHGIRDNELELLQQITDTEKTDNGLYTKCFMCSETPSHIHAEFDRIRTLGTGRNKIISQHIVLECDSSLFAREHLFQAGCVVGRHLLKNEYQHVVSVVKEFDTIRCHIIFNNINLVNGKTFETLENQGRNRAWEKLRNICNEINEMFLPPDVTAVPDKAVPFIFNEKKKLSNRFMLKWCINYSVAHNQTWDSFIDTLKKYNVDVLFDPGKPKNIKFRLGENMVPVSAKKLGWAYESQQLRQQMWLLHSRTHLNKPSDRRVHFDHLFFDRFGINRWTDIQHWDRSERMVNTILQLGVNSLEELESHILLEHIELWKAFVRLNSLQDSIYKINGNLTWLYAVKKYKSYYDEMSDKNLSGCSDLDEKSKKIIHNYNKAKKNLDNVGEEWASGSNVEKFEDEQENLIKEWRLQKKKNTDLKEKIKEMECLLDELNAFLNQPNFS